MPIIHNASCGRKAPEHVHSIVETTTRGNDSFGIKTLAPKAPVIAASTTPIGTPNICNVASLANEAHEPAALALLAAAATTVVLLI
jgi:hypothetical protein